MPYPASHHSLLSSLGFCGDWFIWRRCFWLGLVDGLLADVAGVGDPGSFMLSGGTHTDSGVWSDGARAVDPQWWLARAASMSSQRPWLQISSALYKEFRASARAKPIGDALRPRRGDRLAVGQGSPVADGPVLHPSVGVVHQARQVGPLAFPLPDGHLQGVQGQVGVQALRSASR